MSELPRLMLVTDRRRARRGRLVEAVGEALAGGVGLVQLREKDLDGPALLELAGAIAPLVEGRATLLVNGDADVARQVGAGLHLPASAPPVLRPPRPWGRSAHDDAELERARDEGADYVIFGPVYPTASKPGHPGRGLDALRSAVRRVAPLPVFAIGGVTVSGVPPVIHAGAHGVAVCGAILGSSRPRRVAEALTLALLVSR